MGQEVELKLEVPPKTIGKLRRMRSLRRRNGHARDKDLVSVYFDTADLRLARNGGITLRYRRDRSPGSTDEGTCRVRAVPIPRQLRFDDPGGGALCR